MALSASVRGQMCGIAAVERGGLGGLPVVEEGQHEVVAGPSGVLRPHLAVSAIGKRPLIAASCMPQAGGKKKIS